RRPRLPARRRRRVRSNSLQTHVSPRPEGSRSMRSTSRARFPGPVLLGGGLAALWIVGVVAAGEEPGAVAVREGPPPLSEETLRAGRELFTRVWLPNDPRSHGGDGLGPVFNGQSCVACHDQGGPGGAGAVGRNIEIATATGLGLPGYRFAYAFGMDFGA